MTPIEETSHESLAWARSLVEENAWVLHQPTVTVGRCAKLHEPGGTYVSTVNPEEPLEEPVLELDSGHTFVARAGNFLQLSDADVKFYNEAVEGVRELLTVMVMVSAGGKIAKTMSRVLLQSALQQQVQKLQKPEKPAA